MDPEIAKRFAEVKPLLENVATLLVRVPLDPCRRALFGVFCHAFLFGVLVRVAQEGDATLAKLPAAEAAQAVSDRIMEILRQSPEFGGEKVH